MVNLDLKIGKVKNIVPTGKVKIGKIFVNSKNNQLTVCLPRKKLKGLKGGIPSKIEVTYWK